MGRLIIGISRHPAVSATDRQMAPGAYVIAIKKLFALKSLCFSLFGMFVHVVFLIFLFQWSYRVVFVYFVYERLLHRTGPSYDGPARCPNRLSNFNRFILTEGGCSVVN